MTKSCLLFPSRPNAEFVIATMQVPQVFSVRLAILMLATPVFLLFSLLALVDGLVRHSAFH